MNIRFRPDSQWIRSSDGMSLIAGSPLSYFKMSKKGAEILTLLENNKPLPHGHESLTNRLIAAGSLHPFVDSHVELSDITAVIPAFVKSEIDVQRLQRLVHSLRGTSMIVVDDCSPFPFTVDGAQIFRHDSNMGPGAARNTGLQLCQSTFVAFVDIDVSITSDTLRSLAAQFTHDSIALVAPRVMSSDTPSRTSEYESHHSPLDLGSHPSLIRPFSRVSYVPAATLVCRTSIARQLDGFNASMRMGEDVDFVWRLINAGFVCRYEPELTCTHESRSSIRAFVRQRFGYGTSAAPLGSVHKSYVSPLRANIVLLLPAIALLSGFFWTFLLTLPVMFAWYLATLRRSGLSVIQRLRITTQGEVSTIRLLATAITRAWWPIAVALSFIWNGAEFALAVSVLCPALFGVFRHKPKNIVTYMVLRVLDNLSYGLGVWWGALRTKNVRCFVPAITRSPLRLRSKG